MKKCTNPKCTNYNNPIEGHSYCPFCGNLLISSVFSAGIGGALAGLAISGGSGAIVGFIIGSMVGWAYNENEKINRRQW